MNNNQQQTNIIEHEHTSIDHVLNYLGRLAARRAAGSAGGLGEPPGRPSPLGRRAEAMAAAAVA